MPEVVAALRKLSASEGITWQKIEDTREGACLRQLQISQDEFNRTRDVGVNLAMATVAALTCVRQLPQWGSVSRLAQQRQLDLILDHEFNLSGNFGSNLTGRRDARAAVDELDGRQTV